MEIGQSFRDPCLAPSVLDVLERAEPRLASAWIGGDGRHDELEACLTIRIVDSPKLFVENLLPTVDLAHPEIERKRSVVRLGQGQSRDRLGLRPHATHPRYRFRRQRYVMQ